MFLIVLLVEIAVVSSVVLLLGAVCVLSARLAMTAWRRWRSRRLVAAAGVTQGQPTGAGR